MKADELREKFLTFFETKGCVRRPSDVLVPRWDPSVLFTPAGMNQFKDHFLGRCKLEFTRATTCQKCLRTGDIENVGRTPYHHTFFEMLGNFSFGDYFKREAILWAWEFLTDKKWLGLDPEKISATVYLDDDEAAEIWIKEVGLSPDKVTRMGEDENFWPANAPSQGPDGVCGPCSEIYYDTPWGKVEIWNLVFTQYNRVGPPPNNLRPLPSKNIDTGMGLERAAAVLQGVESNFHIDIIRPIVEAAADVCHVKYDPSSDFGRRLRRIADHIRACTFAIHENVTPSPNKQGYVIRRLIRRAVLDGHRMGVREPFFYKLVPVVAEMMKNPYPELQETIPRVQAVIKGEEENFLAVLETGLERIERLFEEMRRNNRGVVSGAEAAELYQTYGFPPELLEALAAERNYAFDWEGYRREMERHGLESGAGQKKEVFYTGPLDSLKKAGLESRFVGYETTEVPDAKIIGLIAAGHLCDAVEEKDHGQPVAVILDKTPFYGEMGGQVGDRGELVADGLRFEVIDTKMESGFPVHYGHLRDGRLALGQVVTARVDAARRQGIRRAHTATHLLHYALQKVLGKHAQQQGSKVDDDILRFDFANPTAVKAEELEEIEAEVNRRVLEAAPVQIAYMPLAEARKTGAMMLFGEKYPDVVRVVSVGEYSKELCGGTHLDHAGQIGLFKIISEESVAAGTRRITALTGWKAYEFVRDTSRVIAEASAALNVPPQEIPTRIQNMLQEIRQLRKQVALGGRSPGVTAEQLWSQGIDVDGVRVIVGEIPAADPDLMRQLIDQLRRRNMPTAVLLAAKHPEEKKVVMVAGLSRELTDRGMDAVKWVRSVAAVVGGGGGGRPDLAQAGGKVPEKLAEALDLAREQAVKMIQA
ncbi:Alanyl-tRNA synthetase [Thermogutta terrifontis]|uniref:Alanine--tRNA ligase n=1 Tax=Thermogutta terrifontis TaxID=1331910 RepID=A0A286RLB1_9BACT|nr:alanine--tRNA ligase [Thermogutta terrifontis]ASV76754.1 Alanyl-tRNA synthetase [Thermogutta terrifontis]